MKVLALFVGVMTLLVPMAVAQEACPCVPVSHQWIVTPCESWNCAAAQTVMANGDKYVLAMPTASEDFKWIVVKRIVAGSAIVSPDAPFKLDSFDGMPEATARFAGIAAELQPMLLTAPDGKIIVITRTAPERRRSAGH